MKPSELLQHLLRDASRIADSHLLKLVDIDFLRRLETMSPHSQGAAFVEKKLRLALEGADIDSHDRHLAFFTAFGEARAWEWLNSRCAVTPLKEATSKNPDFQITCRGHEFFAEIKSLNMAEGVQKYRDLQNESLIAKADLDEQISSGKSFAIHSRLVQPHKKSRHPQYDPRSPRMIIEALIDRYDQNFKSGQYDKGLTISIMYLHQSVFMLFQQGGMSNMLMPFCIDADQQLPVSGQLWWAAFGEVENFIFKPYEFEGVGILDGQLSRQGILVKADNAKAAGLLALVDHQGRPDLQAGFLRRKNAPSEVAELADCLVKDNWNDEAGSNTWRLKEQIFHFTEPDAKNVLLVGDFTNWQQQPIKMIKGSSGVWTAMVRLSPGEYNYLFIVDGKWCEDPQCHVRVPNPFGGFNMVRQVM